MNRRLIAASLTLGLMFYSSQGSAQILDFNVNNQNQGSMVRQASCSCETSGAHFGGGQIITAAGCGSCGLGACGPGGCPTGDCVGECNFAPYGYCLYPSPCWGVCRGPCCRTIFGEMIRDVRRFCSKRRRFGSLASNAIGASDSGGCAVFSGDVGCSDVGFADGGFDGCCNDRGLFREGLLGRFRSGRLESDCGCESVGICSDEAFSVPLEVACGCEDIACDECSGGCAGGAATCFQDVLSPCRSRGLISRFGEILFGSRCGCGSCSGCCFEADCGVESAGCAAVTRDSETNVVAAQGRITDFSLTARRAPQGAKPVVRSTTRSRLEIASQELPVPTTKKKSISVVRRVRFDQQIAPKTELRFRD